MNLLFDQNISFRVIKKLSDHFTSAKQVRELGLEDSSDIEIWEYAKNNGFTIVTFDADFFDLSNLNGHPPKIIWLRTGNTTTENIANILIDKKELIKDFITNPDNKELACLEID